MWFSVKWKRVGSQRSSLPERHGGKAPVQRQIPAVNKQARGVNGVNTVYFWSWHSASAFTVRTISIFSPSFLFRTFFLLKKVQKLDYCLPIMGPMLNQCSPFKAWQNDNDRPLSWCVWIESSVFLATGLSLWASVGPEVEAVPMFPRGQSRVREFPSP